MNVKCIELCNLYEFLPSYGENDLNINIYGNDLSIIVNFYNHDFEILSKALSFNKVVFFSRSIFPGPSIIDVKCSNPEDYRAGSLIEYQNSAIADTWTRYLGEQNLYRHFHVAFVSQNQSYDIVAFDCLVK